MPRNTLILVIVLAVIAAAVVGVNIGRSSLPREAQVLPPSGTPGTPAAPQGAPTASLISFQDPTCGVSLQYPDTFTKIDIETGGATFIHNTNPEETVVVLCQTDIPRVPLPEDKIEDRRVGTVSAKLYHDASPKDGKPIDKLIFTHPGTKKDVYVAGKGVSYDELIKTLTLFP